jgi:hypothetical protein
MTESGEVEVEFAGSRYKHSSPRETGGDSDVELLIQAGNSQIYCLVAQSTLPVLIT